MCFYNENIKGEVIVIYSHYTKHFNMCKVNCNKGQRLVNPRTTLRWWISNLDNNVQQDCSKKNILKDIKINIKYRCCQ